MLTALRFAADKHKNQRRKDEEASPYINHPIAVADTLWQIGEVRDVVTIVGALLHDTIEDTETEPSEIETLFGKEVLSLVQEMSDDKSLPKATRKQLQIEHAPHISTRAKQLKLSDKICNVRDIATSPPSHWDWQRRLDYLDWTEQVVRGIRGTSPRLESLYDEVTTAARQKLAEERPTTQ